MELLLEDRLGLVDLELGLEVARVGGVRSAVGPAARLGEVEVGFILLQLVPDRAPVALAAAPFLHALGVGALKAILSKELGQVGLRRRGGGLSGVVLVVVLV